MVVVGPPEAGKSTLIKALSPTAMNLEVQGRTVAMDHGTATIAGVAVSLIGVPGQTRFAAIREVLTRGTRLAVWVHPADQILDLETRELIRRLAVEGVPYVVLVNHRAAGPWANGWAQPADLPEPHEVIHGNLGDRDHWLHLVEASIARHVLR